MGVAQHDQLRRLLAPLRHSPERAHLEGPNLVRTEDRALESELRRHFLGAPGEIAGGQVVRRLVHQVTSKILSLRNDAPALERGARGGIHVGAAAGEVQPVDPPLRVALRAVAVGVVVADDGALDRRLDRLRVHPFAIQQPRQVVQAAGSNVPDRSRCQAPELGVIEFLLLAGADDQQLRDCESRRPVDERTLIRLAGKLPAGVQFLEQCPCLAGQALHHATSGRPAFEAVYGEHGR